MKIRLLSLAGLIGCASLPLSNYWTEKHEGETEDYSVEASQSYINNFCVERIIILRERSGMHIKQNHVDYVWSRDRDCNNTIDEWRFRNVQTRPINYRRLEEDVIFAFERIWPIR